MSRSRRRRGVVLGAGGVLGAAWTIGALQAIADVEGFDPHEAGADWSYDSSTGGAHPPRPRLAVGSPALLRRSVVHPRQLPPLAVLAALTPAGKGSLSEVGR